VGLVFCILLNKRFADILLLFSPPIFLVAFLVNCPFFFSLSLHVGRLIVAPIGHSLSATKEDPACEFTLLPWHLSHRYDSLHP